MRQSEKSWKGRKSQNIERKVRDNQTIINEKQFRTQ